MSFGIDLRCARGFGLKFTRLVTMVAVAGLNIGLVLALSVQAAQGAGCASPKHRKVQESTPNQREKLQLLQRRGTPTLDSHHALGVCDPLPARKLPPTDPPPANQPPPTSQPPPTDPPPSTDPPPGGTAVPNGGPGGSWTLQFEDEFSGESLDTANWVNENSAASPNYGPQGGTSFDPSNVTVSGGHASFLLHPNTPYAGSPHSGSRIDTYGKFSYTYGYLEFRAKMPNYDGSWAGLWTNADSHPGSGPDWPANGEFDVAETLGDNNTPQVHIHEGVTQGSLQDRAWSGGGRTYADAATAWHTYAMDWEANQVRFYYDGNLVSTYAPAVDRGWVPNTPQHVILYLEALNSGSPPPADSMQVDYVRVWQH